MAKRVIEIREAELINDITADRLSMTNKNLSRLMQYHFTNNVEKHCMDIVVHGFQGETCRKSFSEIYIAGSHNHPQFFKLLQHAHRDPFVARHLSETTWIPRVRLREINQLLVDMRLETPLLPISRQIKNSLSEAECKALPREFKGYCLPVAEPCISFIHPALLRTMTDCPSKTIRWKFLFRCRSLNTSLKDVLDERDMYSIFPQPYFARKYEENLIERKSPWPYKIKAHDTDPQLLHIMKQRIQDIGILTLPISTDFVARYINLCNAYMHKLMQCPSDIPIITLMAKDSVYRYRNRANFRSSHIPMHTGRTMYGHHCTNLKALCLEIEPLIYGLFHCMYPDDNQIWVTTSEIIIQHSHTREQDTVS